VKKNKTFIALNNEGITLEKVYDSKTNTYYFPVQPNNQYTSFIKKQPKDGYFEQEIKAAVLDTGILMDHPDIKNNIIGSKDFTGEGIEDLNGHGTIVAMILKSSAPAIKIYNVKVLDKNKRGFEESIIRGIRWAIQRKVNTIGFSIGQEKNCNKKCKLREIINEAITKGIIITAAAGNDPEKSFCPAKCKRVISVGATNASGDKIADYSSKADFYLPGSISLLPYNKKINILHLTSEEDTEK
jgi:subtilisin family serine protease